MTYFINERTPIYGVMLKDFQSTRYTSFSDHCLSFSTKQPKTIDSESTIYKKNVHNYTQKYKYFYTMSHDKNKTIEIIKRAPF